MEKAQTDDLLLRKAQRYLYLEQRRLKWLIGEAERGNVLVPEEIARMREQLEIIDYLIAIINRQ